MTKDEKTILVLGATGRQGGATARHLLANGWKVRILLRNPAVPVVAPLQQAGAEVVQGDFEDRASLERAMQGVYGVFSVQGFSGPAGTPELLQGKNVVDAASAVGVEHFVYTSVQSAEALAQVAGDSNKWVLEQYLHASGLPYTIVRPCLFMDDLLSRYVTAQGNFESGFQADVPIGLIASEDIGAMAAYVFAHPAELLGKTIEIASDILTPVEIANTLSRVLGRTIPFIHIPIEEMRRLNPIIARAYEYLNEVGYTADMATLRRWYPDLMSLATWLERYAVPTHVVQ